MRFVAGGEVMCKELDEELERGKQASEALAEHLMAMGAAKSEGPVYITDPLGRLHEFKVSVEYVACIDTPEVKP